jgi:hypothetical protein
MALYFLKNLRLKTKKVPRIAGMIRLTSHKTVEDVSIASSVSPELNPYF